MKRFFNLSLTLIFASFSNYLLAQNCLENLVKGNSLLEGGNMDACIELVTPCCNKLNDESIRWQAFRLKSICYLLKGNNDSAKVAAENMLEINPRYSANLLRDPKEFINLLNSIVVIPKFTIGLAFSAGTNYTFPEITQGYLISDYKKEYNFKKGGLQFGTNLGLYLNPNLSLELGIMSTTKKFEINYNLADFKINIKEKLNYLEVPLSAKYIFTPKQKLRFFAQAGAYSGYLLYANNSFKSTNIVDQSEFSLTKLNIIERRNRWNFGVMGGLGVYYKFKKGHLNLQANYYRSFSKINKAENRYKYQEQIYTYYFVDDDLILHNLGISLGWAYYMNYKVYKK